MKCRKWFCVYKPHPAVNVRGFINPIRHLGVNYSQALMLLLNMWLNQKVTKQWKLKGHLCQHG